MKDLAARASECLGLDDCTDIDAVVAAADKWCHEHDASLSFDLDDPGKYYAQVLWNNCIESCIDKDLCVAIISACIQAAPKLKHIH
jgi:hypothetical protein